MMESIKEWAISLCGAAALCATVGMIAPEGKTGKCMKLVMTLVVLCLMLSPLSQIGSCSADLKDHISLPAETDSDLLRLVEEQSAEAISRSVNYVIEEQLETLGVHAKEINVSVDSSDDGCITISQADAIVQNEGHDLREIERTLGGRLGFEVILCWEAENDVQ